METAHEAGSTSPAPAAPAPADGVVVQAQLGDRGHALAGGVGVHPREIAVDEDAASRAGQDAEGAGPGIAEVVRITQSRGFSEDEAAAMIVNGFIEPVTKELPMEYAVELNG